MSFVLSSLPDVSQILFLFSGLPPFQPPPFSLNDTVTGNVTSFGGMISELGSAVAIIPLLGILENVAIAKAFGKGSFTNDIARYSYFPPLNTSTF